MTQSLRDIIVNILDQHAAYSTWEEVADKIVGALTAVKPAGPEGGRGMPITEQQLEEAQAKLAEAEKNVERWKERAEFEYSKNMYPDKPGLAVGALDAHMRSGWVWAGKQKAIEEAIATQENPK